MLSVNQNLPSGAFNLMHFPEELLTHIHSHCAYADSLNLTLTNRQIKTKIEKIQKELAVSYYYHICKNTPIDVLANIFKRFENISHLNFGKGFEKMHFNASVEFISPLISFLENHTFKHLRVVKLHEIASNKDDMNFFRKLISALSNQKIEDFHLKTKNLCSQVNASHTQEVIDKCTRLQSFTLDAYEFDASKLEMEFSQAKHLTSLSLLDLRAINTSLARELNRCSGLRALAVHTKDWQVGKKLFEDFLSVDVRPNLEILDFGDSKMFLSEELIAKSIQNLPNIRALALEAASSECTDKTLKLLADKCPNLTTLKFNFKSITEHGFIAFAKQMTKLEKLSIYQAYNITDIGLIALAQYRPKLKALSLIHCKLTSAALEALAAGCLDLKFLQVDSCSEAISEHQWHAFVEAAPNLRYLDCKHKKNFPNLQSIGTGTFEVIT